MDEEEDALDNRLDRLLNFMRVEVDLEEKLKITIFGFSPLNKVISRELR